MISEGKSTSYFLWMNVDVSYSFFVICHCSLHMHFVSVHVDKTLKQGVDVCVSQASTSSDSLDGPCVDYAKSYDAVVFDVLKVTPEEFAVSMIQMLPQ